MLKQTKILAAGLMGAMLLSTAPATTLADGAASTRNILIGVGAAAGTLLIINHNKKVHQKYAEDAQKQAALAQQRDDAQTAAHQYKVAYENETQVAQALKKEVSIQQDQISKLQTQIAALNPGSSFVAAKPVAATATHTIAASQNQQVVSYGWGTF
jgi:hypothetical protein